jgi:starch synthase
MTGPPSNPAVVYRRGDYQTSTHYLMGRLSANESFLTALARHARSPVFPCYSPTAEDFDAFTGQVTGARGREVEARWIGLGDHGALAEAQVVYLPGCNLAQFGRFRHSIDQRAYSLCGLTHAMSADAAVDAVAQLALAPVGAWDALICTSQAIRRAVDSMLEVGSEYLRARLGASGPFSTVELPVIPLGIDSGSFEGSAHGRQAWRQRLELPADDLVVLFVGRLSHNAKAHPGPLCLALERATRRLGRRIHLVHCGWFANAQCEGIYRDACRAMAPAVDSLFVDGHDPAVRTGIWQVADVFVSLSDNIQESFGLTPVEAMAAGLPVIVSDWDGYRDTVRDGVDGVTIPTLIPPPGSGRQVSRAYEEGRFNHELYVGSVSLSTSVDVSACEQALVTLLSNPTLRGRMGDSGRRRAREVYDWSRIIPRYEDLWRELGERRAWARRTVPARLGRALANPWLEDPFAVYRGHATQILDTSARVSAASTLARDFRAVSDVAMNTFELFGLEGPAIGRPAFREELVASIEADGPCSVGDLLAGHPSEDPDTVMRALVWLAKFGLVSLGDHNVEQKR